MTKRLNITGLVQALFVALLCVSISTIARHTLSVVQQGNKLSSRAALELIAIAVVCAAIAAFVWCIKKSQNKSIFLYEKQYFEFFERSPAPMAIVDALTHRYIAVNNATLACFGYTTAEFLNMTPNDIMTIEQQSFGDSPGSTDFETCNSGLKTYKKKNGDVILTEVLAGTFIFKNKKCYWLLTQDSSEILKAREEKKIAEEEKKKQQHFTTFVLENFPVDVAVFDQNHRYLFLNKTAVKNDEMRNWMIGKDDFEYFSLKGKGADIAQKRRDAFLRAIAGENTEWIDEHFVDERVKFVLRKFYPYYENDSLKYVFGYGTDITELKKAEMQRNEYVVHLEKIAFETSHKIRNPVCNLQGLLSVIDMEKIDNPDVKKIIAHMHQSVRNLDEFTRDLAEKLEQYQRNLSGATSSLHS